MAIRGEESPRALHQSKSHWKFVPYSTTGAGGLLEPSVCCRPAHCSRERGTHWEVFKIHWFYLIRPVQPRVLPELIVCSRIPLSMMQLMGFSPQILPRMTEELVGCVLGAHPMGACFCSGQVSPLGGVGGGEWGGRRGEHQGVALSPASPRPGTSALLAPARAGLCLSAGELQQNWRGLILVGVLFSLPRRSKWRWSYNLRNFWIKQGEIFLIFFFFFCGGSLLNMYSVMKTLLFTRFSLKAEGFL